MNEKTTAYTQEEFHRRMLRHAKTQTLCMLVIALALVVAVLYVGSLGGKLESALALLQAFTEELSAADLPALIDDARTLVNDAHSSLTGAASSTAEALKKLNTLDIETLNEAIADLAAVVEPLSRLFGR